MPWPGSPADVLVQHSDQADTQISYDHGSWTLVQGRGLSLIERLSCRFPTSAIVALRSTRQWCALHPPGQLPDLISCRRSFDGASGSRFCVQARHNRHSTLLSSPWVVVTADGVVANVLDLTDLAIQKELGTTLAELTGEWVYSQSLGKIAPTQLLGYAAHSCGITGLRYSSAKAVGSGTALAVFTDHLASNSANYLEVIDPHNNLNQRLP